MRRMGLLSLMLVFLCTCGSALAVGLVIVDNPPPPASMPRLPYPPEMPPPWHYWRPEPYVFAPLQVTAIDVQVQIKDQVAVTTIQQEFYNPNAARIEGTFVCPLPKGSQIDRFSMEIDGRPCTAELLKAGKARSIYEDIVRKMKDPALLEYSGRDLFKVRIFPFDPHGKRRVSLKYTQLLKSDAGLVGYSLPLSAEKFSCGPVSNIKVNVEIESAKPLKSIYSPTHEVDVKRSGPKKAEVTIQGIKEAVPADFVLYFAPEKDTLGMSLLASRAAGEDGYFLLMASPGVDVPESEVVARDIVFVLDTSGSMAGPKLDQAKKALEFCVENLNEKDRFELIRFSTEVEPLFDGLVPATHDNRRKAIDFAKRLKPMGGTAIDDALKKALSVGEHASADVTRPAVIVFLTDGRPTIGETSEETIVRNVKKLNTGHQRVFCFGIGTDVNTHLLDKVTEQTRAFSQYVLPEEDLEVKVSGFFSKIKEPVLADPKLQVSGEVRVSAMYPTELPDLFKGEQLVVAGRYHGSGDVAFTIVGLVNGKQRKFSFEGTLPESASGHDFLPRLWATRRIGYLLDEIRLHGQNKELKDEVTELARRYGIVTPYTSYLIVEDEDRRRIPRESQLLQQLHTDNAARMEGGRMWDSFQNDRGGVNGTAAARESYAYKNASAPASAAFGGAQESYRALGVPMMPPQNAPASSMDSGKLRLAQYTQQAQFVAGRTFFQNGNQWVDSAIQKHPGNKAVQVRFGSQEYFDLAAANPDVLPWLALGRNVQFVLGNVNYQVQE